MIISVINHTQLPRQEIQNVIRAVNRQLQEDFRRYWHKDVQLRLEGWTGEAPSPKIPFDMRGDAVLYLWDEDDVEDALGYHSVNNSGVPFGFVFTELSKLLNEPWSVTLSHEALEMAMDAEVNLLTAGPHPDPDEGERIVYHWYELCDAVQADIYTIDGIEVSNFVLPLYFTVDDEHANHNDFLGTGIASFNLNPGGYVGFFDPETSSHETYHNLRDEIAANRMKDTAKFGAAKRLERHRYPRRRESANDLARITCNTIVFEVSHSPRSASERLALAKKLAKNALGDAWEVKVYPHDRYEFDAIHTGRRSLCLADAWEHAHEIASDPDVVYAEPSFVFPIKGETDVTHADRRTTIRRSSVDSSSHKRGTEQKMWSVQRCAVPAAWQLLESQQKLPGEGVRIGHPDSGYLVHAEVDSCRVLDSEDWDFVEGDADARTNSLQDGSHGLATASVIMSGKQGEICGPALHSEILPLRVTKPGTLRPTPVLLHAGMHRLRDAIDYAVEKDCHVISISLGGPPHAAVHKAIRRATSEGVIVLAAAGNQVGFVVWPARYPETIAVAGCDVDGKPWEGSSRGQSVDITAPAESVWRATLSRDGEPIVERSSGTSYAVAITAGVTALWLGAHATQLKHEYSKQEIPSIFRRLLLATATPSPSLPTDKFGAGIVNANDLLKAPLQSAGRSDFASSVIRRALQHHALEEKLGIRTDDLTDGFVAELACAEALGAFAAERRKARDQRGRTSSGEAVRYRGLSPQLRRALSAAGG